MPSSLKTKKTKVFAINDSLEVKDRESRLQHVYQNSTWMSFTKKLDEQLSLTQQNIFHGVSLFLSL